LYGRVALSRAIDVLHLGRDRVICAFEVDGLIVDPGPASCVDTLLDRLGGVEPRALLLTHVHLDHAGAAGVLCRRYPDLTVYVHERGARHLIDPTKLVESAGRVWGDDMWELWGEVAPVPEERLRVLEGGETVEGFRVAYTPGHASHHVAYLHDDSGDAYVGDVAGVRLPPYEHTIAPTPPPDIDVEAWLDSLHTVASWNPQSLCLTHFGPVTDVADQLHRVRHALNASADSARLDGEEGFIAKLESSLAAATDPATVEAFEQAAPPDQLYQGLSRYWRKKAE
jgi:glyoxylase-like metal-dependent hydrolase (beta-lactamase superfamily II)